MSLTLEDVVRRKIGSEGPQLPEARHEERIDFLLAHMTAQQVLSYISAALEEAGVVFPERP